MDWDDHGELRGREEIRREGISISNAYVLPAEHPTTPHAAPTTHAALNVLPLASCARDASPPVGGRCGGRARQAVPSLSPCALKAHGRRNAHTRAGIAVACDVGIAANVASLWAILSGRYAHLAGAGNVAAYSRKHGYHSGPSITKDKLA